MQKHFNMTKLSMRTMKVCNFPEVEIVCLFLGKPGSFPVTRKENNENYQ